MERFAITDFYRDKLFIYGRDGTRYPDEDFNLEMMNNSPTGIVSIKNRLAVIDFLRSKFFIYGLRGTRYANEDFDLDPANSNPLASDATKNRLVFINSNSLNIFFYGHDGTRYADEDFNLDELNDSAIGIAATEDRLAVLNDRPNKVFIYGHDGTRYADEDFNLDELNGTPTRIAATEDRLAVINSFEKIFFYGHDGTRYEDEDFNLDNLNTGSFGITFYFIPTVLIGRPRIANFARRFPTPDSPVALPTLSATNTDLPLFLVDLDLTRFGFQRSVLNELYLNLRAGELENSPALDQDTGFLIHNLKRSHYFGFTIREASAAAEAADTVDPYRWTRLTGTMLAKYNNFALDIEDEDFYLSYSPDGIPAAIIPDTNTLSQSFFLPHTWYDAPSERRLYSAEVPNPDDDNFQILDEFVRGDDPGYLHTFNIFLLGNTYWVGMATSTTLRGNDTSAELEPDFVANGYIDVITPLGLWRFQISDSSESDGTNGYVWAPNDQDLAAEMYHALEHIYDLEIVFHEQLPENFYHPGVVDISRRGSPNLTLGDGGEGRKVGNLIIGDGRMVERNDRQEIELPASVYEALLNAKRWSWTGATGPLIDRILRPSNAAARLALVHISESTITIGLNPADGALSSQWQNHGVIGFEIGGKFYQFKGTVDTSAPYQYTFTGDLLTLLTELYGLIFGTAKMVLDGGSVPSMKILNDELWYSGFVDGFQQREDIVGAANYRQWRPLTTASSGRIVMTAGTRYQFRNGPTGTPFPANGHLHIRGETNFYKQAESGVRIR